MSVDVSFCPDLEYNISGLKGSSEALWHLFRDRCNACYIVTDCLDKNMLTSLNFATSESLCLSDRLLIGSSGNFHGNDCDCWLLLLCWLLTCDDKKGSIQYHTVVTPSAHYFVKRFYHIRNNFKYKFVLLDIQTKLLYDVGETPAFFIESCSH